MLQRPAAACLERYLSSRSPPDHLLYQMLKIVPVWGGGSDLMVEGSTWGRAGRRLRRMIFFTFFSVSGTVGVRVVSVLVVVREVLVGGGMVSSSIRSVESVPDGMVAGGRVSTSAMLEFCLRMSWMYALVELWSCNFKIALSLVETLS